MPKQTHSPYLYTSHHTIALMELVKIDLIRLRNTEYMQYLEDYLHHLDNNDPALLHISTEHAALASLADQIEALLQQDYSAPLTATIHALDLQRGQILGAFFTTITGLSGHYESGKRAAAMTIKRRLYIYGTVREIKSESLQGKSAIIDNLADDLLSIAAYSSALATLDLTDWVSHLVAVNLEFQEKYMERTVHNASLNPDTIKRLRQEANAAFYHLRELLLAQGLVAGFPAPFPKAIHELNALTIQYNATLAQRAGYADRE